MKVKLVALFIGQVGRQADGGNASNGSLIRLRQLAAAKCSQFDPSVAVRPILSEPQIEGIASKGKIADANRFLEAVVQPWRKASTIYLPNGQALFDNADRITSGEVAIYKGFSLDPSLAAKGERVDIIDSLGMMKTMIMGFPQMRFVGVMADGCWMANTRSVRDDPALQELKYSPRLAAMVVEKFLEKLGKTDDGMAVKESADIRTAYLERMFLKLLVANFSSPNYSTLLRLSTDIWQKDFARYTQCLQQAIEFCMKRADGDARASVPIKEGDRIILRGPNYNRYNTDFQKLYVPFVFAESLYLATAYGAKVSLCPTSERGFSRLMRKFDEQTGAGSIGDIWFERAPDIVLDCVKGGKPMDRITFRDGQWKIRSKLAADLYYAAWMGEVLEPFVPGSMAMPGNPLSVKKLAGNLYDFAVENRIPVDSWSAYGYGFPPLGWPL